MDAGSAQSPTTATVKVSASRIDLKKGAQLIVRATDRFGNSVVCDPVQTTVTKMRQDKGVQTFTDIPYAEHLVTIENGTPGLRALAVIVNGVEFVARRLEDGEVATLNVKSAMRPGLNNTITLEPRGRKGETADVTIGPID